MRKQLNRRQARVLALGLLALGAGPAAAVSISSTGLGQVLLFPYYSARTAGGSPNTTIISLSNAGPIATVVGVSFLEGKAGKQVLGFNLFLAPSQTWVAAVSPSASGGAQISTGSTACSDAGFAPQPIGGEGNPPPRLVPGVPVSFRNLAYVGDGVGNGLDRTLEGYVQVIEMATYLPGSQTAIAITPVNGVATCATSAVTAQLEQQPPQGQLMGHAEIRNSLAGTAYAAEPTVLESFKAQSNYTDTGTIRPTLSEADPIAVWTSPTQTIVADFFTGHDAVSAVLMRDSLLNQFAIASFSQQATDWIVTFPTKRHYVTTGFVQHPFQRSLTAFGACDDIAITLPGFTPAPPGGLPAAVPALCWATNAISFNSTNLLGSANRFTLSVPAAVTDNWASVTFAQTGVPAGVHVLTTDTATVIAPPGPPTSFSSMSFFGLPAIGFAARFSNYGVLPGGVNGKTTATAPHKFSGVAYSTAIP